MLEHERWNIGDTANLSLGSARVTGVVCGICDATLTITIPCSEDLRETFPSMSTETVPIVNSEDDMQIFYGDFDQKVVGRTRPLRWWTTHRFLQAPCPFALRTLIAEGGSQN